MGGPHRISPAPIAAVCVVLVGALALAACQTTSSSAATQRLDRSTGVTLATARTVMVFARTEARYSRSARDYVYLGPVETNRQGLREYYLWVGVATTLDRGYLAPEIRLPTSLELLVNGEPMVFDLLPWSQTIPGLSPTAVYATPVDLRGQLGARATRDQLRLITEAPPDSILIGGQDGAARRYEPWGEPASWGDLLGSRD